ncbi:hypothetical protein ACFSL6_21070 [Paenibacillus thailandensis]|uniref:hypothetical protein n=1 Tax=Paenibacillus thailandensis TaxID=393250 RepID=UPI00363C3DFA
MPMHYAVTRIHTKIEELNAMLSQRHADEVDFVIKVAREFLNTIDRRKRDGYLMEERSALFRQKSYTFSGGTTLLL